MWDGAPSPAGAPATRLCFHHLGGLLTPRAMRSSGSSCRGGARVLLDHIASAVENMRLKRALLIAVGLVGCGGSVAGVGTGGDGGLVPDGAVDGAAADASSDAAASL